MCCVLYVHRQLVALRRWGIFLFKFPHATTFYFRTPPTITTKNNSNNLLLVVVSKRRWVLSQLLAETTYGWPEGERWESEWMVSKGEVFHYVFLMYGGTLLYIGNIRQLLQCVHLKEKKKKKTSWNVKVQSDVMDSRLTVPNGELGWNGMKGASFIAHFPPLCTLSWTIEEKEEVLAIIV